MAGFNLGEELDPLDFDFRPYVDAHGTIPEPSNERIQQLRIALRNLYGSALQDEERFAGKTEAEVRKIQIAEIKSNKGSKEAEEQERRLIKALAIACSDSPSEAQIKELPYRGRQAFMGWLVGKFLTNENETNDMNESQVAQATG